jgi:hypothetical protein
MTGHVIQLNESAAIAAFTALDASVPSQGDAFFHQFGCGNVVAGINQPFERLLWYERLLESTRDHDEAKFSQMHKGQGYHSMAWISYQLQNFDTSLYYLDNAIAEDIRSFGSDWKNSPACCFLKLTPKTFPDGSKLVTNPIINATRDALTEIIADYHKAHGFDGLNVDSLAKRLFKLVGDNVKYRSLVSALYVFTLEKRRRATELRLRSEGGGSIAPFLTFLLKGCVCFESLLKISYGGKTLGDAFKHPSFSTDFGFSVVGMSATTLADVIFDMLRHWYRRQVPGHGEAPQHGRPR